MVCDAQLEVEEIVQEVLSGGGGLFEGNFSRGKIF